MTLLRRTDLPDVAKQQLLASLEVLRAKYVAPPPAKPGKPDAAT